MADGVNKKGNLPKHLEDINLERDRRLDAINGKRQYGHDEISKAISELKEDFGGAATSAERLGILEQISASANLRQDVNNRAAMDINAQNDITVGRIATYTKEQNINTRTTSMSNQASFFKEARQNAMLTMPTEVLEQRIRSGIGDINALGKDLSETVQGRTRTLGSEFYDVAGQIGEKENEVALLKRIRSQQSRSGLSTEKIYNKFEDVYRSGSDALGVLGDRAIIDRAKRGEFGSLEQETKKLEAVLKKLEETFSEYQSASETFAADQTEANKKILDATLERLRTEEKATDEQKKIVRATDMYGGGGGTIGERISAWGGAAGRVTGSIRDMAITSDISEMRLKTATAQTAVDQYNRVNAAVMEGDMMSMLLETGSADFIKEYSDKLRSREIATATAGNFSNALGAAGKVTDKAMGGFSTGGWKGAIAGAGVEGIAGGMEVAAGVYQQGLGIPQTITALEAQKAALGMATVMNTVGAQGLQSVRDHAMNSWRAGIGAGGGAGAMEQTLISPEYVAQLAEMGISASQAAQLSGMSVGALGGREAATGVTRRAAAAQRTGIMSAESFVGMSGQLAGVGGGTENLEKIMANAVAAGMDNAKNIQQMVSATVALSGNLSKMGVSGAAGAAGMVGAFTQDLKAAGVDPNIAAIAAESQLQMREQMDAHKGMDLGTMLKFKQIREQFPEASTMQMELMAGLTATELNNFGNDSGLQAALPFLGDADRRRQLGQISADATKTNIGFGTIATSETDEAVALRLQKMRRETTVNLVGREAAEGALGVTDSHGRRMQEEATKRGASVYGTAADGDINKVLTDITTVLKVLSENLSPEKAQKNVESAAADMKTVGPVMTDAGKAFSGAAAEFSSAVKQFDQTLKNIKLPEHATNRPAVDSTNGRTFKGNKQ